MSENATRPAFVLLGGVSHTPVFFEALIRELHTRGYESHAVAYPTVGQNTEGMKQEDEIKAVQAAVSHYVDIGHQDVILVLHSYGGWPGSRAIVGFDKETRLKEGKKHGVIDVVFIAAFLLPDNAPMARYSHLPDWLTNENGVRIPNEKSVPLLFSDLNAEHQRHWLSRFEPHRNDFEAETVPGAPWHLPLPKTYIITADDKTATPHFQFMMLQGVFDSTWSIKSLKAGHEPFLSHPKQLAELILQPTY